MRAIILMWLSAALCNTAHADNLDFLPGDVYFTTRLSAEDLNAVYSDKALTLRYNTGRCEMAECAYIGFNTLKISGVPNDAISHLTTALENAETRLVPKQNALERAWHSVQTMRGKTAPVNRLCPEDKQQVLVYPRAFNPKTTELLDHFNEAQTYEAEIWHPHPEDTSGNAKPPAEDCCPEDRAVPPLGPSPTVMGETLTMKWADAQLIVMPTHTHQRIREHDHVQRKPSQSFPLDYGKLDGVGFYTITDALYRVHYIENTWEDQPLDRGTLAAGPTGCQTTAAPMGLWLLISALLARRRTA